MTEWESANLHCHQRIEDARMSRLKIDIGVGLVGTIGVAAVTVRGLAVKPVKGA